MFLSQVRLILAAILALVLGACDALPAGDFTPDGSAGQRVEQSAARVISPLEVSYSQVENPPAAYSGPGDKRQSSAPSEIPPIDSSREGVSLELHSPPGNAEYSAENPNKYSVEAIDYLTEVGFGVEYGASPPVLRRWADDIRIKVHGEPTNADQSALQDVIQELNQLALGLKLTANGIDANLDIYFIPEARFAALEPKYVPVNRGFFRVWWDGDGVIYRGKILISSQGVTQQERSHLIREELTQTLGLFRDSWQYQDSIFYQGWTATEEYSPLDRQIIGMLYSPQVEPGMNRQQVLGALGPD